MNYNSNNGNKNKVKNAVLETIDELDFEFEYSELESGVLEKVDTNIATSTVRTHIYDAIEDLKFSDKIIRLKRGIYMKLADYSVDNLRRNQLELSRGVESDLDVPS